VSIYTKCYEKELEGLPPIYAFLMQDAVDKFERYSVLPTSSPPPEGGWEDLFKAVKSGSEVLPDFDSRAPKQTEAHARSIIQVLPRGIELLQNEGCSFSGMSLAHIGFSDYGMVIERAIGTLDNLAKRFPEHGRDMMSAFTESVAEPQFIYALKSVHDALILRSNGQSSDENADANSFRERAIIKAAIKSGSEEDTSIVKSFFAPLTPENKRAWKNAKAAERKKKSRKKKASVGVSSKRKSIPSNLLTFWLPLFLWQKSTSVIAFTIEDDSPQENLDLTDRAIRYEKAIDKAVFDLKLYRHVRE